MAATTTKTTFPYKNKKMSLIFIKHVISGDLYCCCGSLLDSDHKCKILKFVSKITVVSCDDDCKKCDVDEKKSNQRFNVDNRSRWIHYLFKLS